MADLSSASFKVLGTDGQPFHGGTGVWTPGEWRTVEGVIVPCENGLHYCKASQLVRWLGPTIWLFEDGSPVETVVAQNKLVTRRGRVVERLETWNDRTARLFAADCAEAVLGFIPFDHRLPFVAAVDAARRFARGEIGEKERAAARDAAWDAPRTRGAAWGAAWSAARDAARDAPWDAAASAADGAAAAAAAAAAEDAGGGAGWDAARGAQTALLFEYLNGEKT